MNYEDLKHFIAKTMRMSHIYQPVLLKHLLEQDGNASDVSIASVLLKHDPSQVEYYQKIANNMVGRVLRKHNVIAKNKNHYSLRNFPSLTTEQKDELIELCEQKINEYIFKRGESIWNHRKNIREYVSGTTRYEVLKRAEFHCELCGISAKEKALEVDHIDPVNKGGKNELENYQALCYSCNAIKRDRDNTNFTEVKIKYEPKANDCIFCHIDEDRVIDENSLAYVIRDKFPVSKYHSLIIPKRHFKSYFEISQAESNAVQQLLLKTQNSLVNKDLSISGFNIGINIGDHAGQTIFHTHIHIIPRRKNDVDEPAGGIRNIFFGKGRYK